MSTFPSSPGRPRKVLVTRAADQAGDLALRVRELGCAVVEFPLISIIEPADGGAAMREAVERLGAEPCPYAWIVLTSPNAAQRTLRTVKPTTAVRVAAIGPGTAAVCRELGFHVELVPHRSVGEGMVETFPDAAGGDSRVLLPRAESARDVVADGLRSKGWLVDVVTAYRTVPRIPTPQQCEEAGQADIVICTSSSTAVGLVAALGVPRIPRYVVSIGPQTTATLAGLGVEVYATATPHTLDGLMGEVRKILEQ